MKALITALALIAGTIHLHSQTTATFTVDAGKPTSAISESLHGIFFEEISHAGEGGLYAELIQNRGFEESRIPAGTKLVDSFLVPYPEKPHFMIEPQKTNWKIDWPYKTEWPGWSLHTAGKTAINLSITKKNPLNSATPNSLCINIKQADKDDKAEVINDGFWGINSIAGDDYHLSFYAHTNKYQSPVIVSLQSADGKVLASCTFKSIAGNKWKKYACTLRATGSDPKAKFVMSFAGKGTVWLDFVSLFPAKTFKNRPNGLRKDLAEMIEGLKPSFIRWPGGCFVEGITIESAPNWKNAIGPVEKRPGSYSPWGYWSSDGFGYQEYLQFCEDIGADALYVFNVGVSCEYRSGTYVADSEVRPYIQNALDAIEYAIGPVSGKWGRLRAANGHPKPFPLKYVEIGNEQHGPRYAKRYNLFYDAIHQKYPGIRLIASMGIGDVNRNTLDSMKRVDVADEHAYKDAYWSLRNYDHFDKYKRGNWDMYVGEYATNAGVGQGNMQAALSDAVYILSMEKNADLVKWSSYAPLLVNVNDVDWPVNLINFDAAKAFGRISYYAIKMLRENKAGVNLTSNLLVNKTAVTKPLFAGGIGLGTWDTQTEYKEVEVIENGVTVYKSDFVNKENEWDKVVGEWQVKDGAFTQTAEGEQRFAMLKNKTFETYTLKLKARRTGGYNAFIIPFAVKNKNTYLRAHIGSWLNSHCVFEGVVNGFDVAGISNQYPMKPLETNIWYDIRIEVAANKVDCYLNDSLLMTYTEPDKLFAIAGREKSSGDIILKLVNASNMPAKTAIDLQNVKDIQPALLTTLCADSATVENSFEHPQQYVPVVTKLDLKGSSFEMEWKPYSINVLRIKQAAAAKN